MDEGAIHQVALGADGSIYASGHVWITGTPGSGTLPADLKGLPAPGVQLNSQAASFGPRAWVKPPMPPAFKRRLPRETGQVSRLAPTGYILRHRLLQWNGGFHIRRRLRPGRFRSRARGVRSSCNYIGYGIRARVDSSGNFLWADSLGKPSRGTNTSGGLGIVMAADTSLYAVGSSYGDRELLSEWDLESHDHRTRRLSVQALPPGASITDIVVAEATPKNGNWTGTTKLCCPGRSTVWIR